MPIDARIPLQIQGAQIGQSVMAGQQQRQRNQLFEIAQQDRAADKPVVDAQRNNAASLEAIKADVLGAERLAQFVERRDLTGALADRQQELQRMQAAGLPTKSVEASIAAITEAQQSGDLTNLVKGIQARRQIGERLGLLQAPTGEAGFTLSPGQTRFGSDGTQVASAPAAAPSQAGFELSPGQTRFGPDGKPIASLPAAPSRSDQPPAGYRLKADGNLEFIPGGPADPAVASSNRNLRPIPAAASTGIIANRTSLSQIDRAIATVQKNIDDVKAGLDEPAFGPWNYMGDAVRQRTNRTGVGARAQVADIGSLKIHDRSGAAVTAAEQPRLQPFIPIATDDADVILSKLQNLKANLEGQVEETESFYSPESGYRPIQGSGGSSGGGPRVGTVEDGYRFKGGDPADQANWEQVQ